MLSPSFQHLCPPSNSDQDLPASFGLLEGEDPAAILILATGLATGSAGAIAGAGADASQLSSTTTEAGGAGFIRCHLGVLRARCPLLLDVQGDVVELAESREVVLAALQWIFCEVVVAERKEAGNTSDESSHILARAVRLAKSLGTRDVASFQGRVAARRVAERARGCLDQDLVRGYDEGLLDGSLWLQADEGDPISAGCLPLVRERSAYFGAMLSGFWVESRQTSALEGSSLSSPPILKVHWPREPLQRLLRHLHGAAILEKSDDLQPLLECAKFFEVPSLFESINDWIVSQLTLPTAAGLWRFLRSEPSLCTTIATGGGGGDYLRDFCDADEACFEFYIKHFHKLAGEDDEGYICPDPHEYAPINDLSVPLMHRLLSSGRIDMPKHNLELVVKKFAKAHTAGQPNSAYVELRRSLRPPMVLFNREHRDTLLPVGPVSAGTFVN